MKTLLLVVGLAVVVLTAAAGQVEAASQTPASQLGVLVASDVAPEAQPVITLDQGGTRTRYGGKCTPSRRWSNTAWCVAGVRAFSVTIRGKTTDVGLYGYAVGVRARGRYWPVIPAVAPVAGPAEWRR